jgi:hypothetical protein
MVPLSDIQRKPTDRPLTHGCRARIIGLARTSLQTVKLLWRAWLTRLAWEAVPVAIIAGGFVVQVWIQRVTAGLISTLLIWVSFMVEVGLIWVWNRACILRDLSQNLVHSAELLTYDDSSETFYLEPSGTPSSSGIQ